ncbi:DUF2786 domain-containing protein [Pseudaeromonas pectinilytica]
MDKRILDKIKKLMALAGSSNPHEAANALRKAQILMREHQLSESDVELSDIAEHSATLANPSKAQPKWSSNLMVMIQKAFGITCYFNPGLRRCFFVGYQDRAEIAAYCYTVLARQLKTARREFQASLNKRLKPKTKTARADLFCEGWVSGVYQQVRDLVPSEKEQALVKQYMSEKHARLTAAKVREANATVRDQDAGYAGFIAGKRVKLNAGVGGQETAKLASF